MYIKIALFLFFIYADYIGWLEIRGYGLCRALP
jgi:hypothetical protein